MKELELKYGCNPNQKPSRIYMKEGELPIEVQKMDKLDKCYYWHIITLAKLKLKGKECKKCLRR